MSNEINMIRDDNISFYQDTHLLKSEAYVQTLGWLNSVFGLLYIAWSAYLATVVKNALKTYQFVRQTGYEALGDMEVLEWAARQTRSTFWDWTQIAILALSGLMAVLVIYVSFFVKKYDLYKKQQRYLFELLGLAAAQIVCAVVLPCWVLGNGLPSVAAALASLAFQAVVLLPQLLGSELFFPLEIKNLSVPMQMLNLIVEFMLKRWLDGKHT